MEKSKLLISLPKYSICVKLYIVYFETKITFLPWSTLPNNLSSQNQVETVDNRVQVLKTVPVNLSLNTEQQDTKREQFSGSTGAGATGAASAAVVVSEDGGSPAVAVVKAEMCAPVFMAGMGLHYRVEGEESAARVIYEQSPYEVTTVSHSSYAKDDQQSPPDSPYEEERDGVRKNGDV